MQTSRCNHNERHTHFFINTKRNIMNTRMQLAIMVRADSVRQSIAVAIAIAAIFPIAFAFAIHIHGVQALKRRQPAQR